MSARANELKPLHPRAARPVLERLLAQDQIQPGESEPLAQIYAAVLARPASLPDEAAALIQRFVHHPSERESLLGELLSLLPD